MAVNFHNVDCMEYMTGLKDGAFDLAIVDPPYGINISNNIGRRKGDKKSNYKKVLWDNSAPNAEYFKELKRVSKNQIIWGANHFIENVPFANSSCWLMWDKKFSNDVSFAAFELAYTSFNTTAKKFSSHPNQKDRIHPTQKPVQLYKWLLLNYAKPNDKILDTHGGSMSIAIACHDLGFDLDICELDTEYFNAALKRFKQHTAQTKLF